MSTTNVVAGRPRVFLQPCEAVKAIGPNRDDDRCHKTKHQWSRNGEKNKNLGKAHVKKSMNEIHKEQYKQM